MIVTIDYFYYFSDLIFAGSDQGGQLLKGEMAEWSKAHAWRACKRQKRFMGSNPILSAIADNRKTLIKQVQ